MAWTTPRTWVSGELVTAAIMNSAVRDDLNILKTPINDSGHLEFTDATELTIASGVITVTQNYHKVDTESDAASDDLDTITAGTNVAAGFILHLRVESDARTVVVKNGTGGADNLDIGADVTLDESYKTYSLVYDGADWRPWTFAEAATFSSLSPLTTRGDVLISTSGTVTGTRLAVGASGRVLTSDGTDVSWDAVGFSGLSPLTTRGDVLVSTSGTVTGTRLAVGADGRVLTSDGTDVAWVEAGGGAPQVTIFLPQSNSPPATFATMDLRNAHPVLDFDDSDNESAQFSAVLQPGYDGGGLTVDIYWAATSATSGSVVWDVSFERGTTDIDSDSYASANSATASTNGTSGIITKTTITFTDGAEMDSMAAGDFYRVRLGRHGSNGSDTMSGDAEMLSITVRETA
jgi:hypothetical protein